MKSLLAFLSLFTIVCTLSYAQTPFEPSSVVRLNALLGSQSKDSIKFNDTSIFVAEPNEFMLGYQWADALPGVNKRLWINSHNINHDWIFNTNPYYFHLYPRSTGKNTYFSMDIRGSNENIIGYCMSLQFDPEAPNIDLNSMFIPADYDTLGAITGFGTNRGGKRGTGSFKNRCVWTTDSVPVGDTGRIILSKPKGTDKIYRWQNQQIERNGMRWYLAINLRRNDILWDDSTNLNDTVLSIKLPYKYIIGTDAYGQKILSQRQTFKFDSTSSQDTGMVDKAYYPRGRWMDTRLTSSSDSIFIVRRSMLPKYSDTCDITLSAFFRTIDSLTDAYTINRPFHEHGFLSRVGEIENLDLEVRYFGKCNIAIDWLRLETPMSRALFRGERDTIIAYGVSDVIKDIKQFQGMTGGLPGARVWRLYCSDEPNEMLTRAMRYYSFLLEHHTHAEGGMGDRYVHAVPQKNYWGNTPRYLSNYDAAPFYQYVPHKLVKEFAGYFSPKNHTLGLWWGWKPFKDFPPDIGIDTSKLNFSLLCDGNTDGSGYEKYTFFDQSYIKSCSDTLYPFVASLTRGFNDGISLTNRINYILPSVSVHNTPGLLARQEDNLYGIAFYNHSTLYSGKPWYSNIWIASEWYGNIINSTTRYLTVSSTFRPQTGEEIRLSIWTAIVLGAKGLMYDNIDCEGGDTGKFPDTTHVSASIWTRVGAMGGYKNMDTTLTYDEDAGDTLLLSDNSGGDFIRQGETNRMDKYVNFDSTALALGVNKNRIYIGRKSMRLEVRKIHDRIHTISDTLMKLRLQGWYAKGHLIHLSVKDDDTTHLSKFINLDSGQLKTRPIIRNAVEGWDSTFCDITVHKNVDISMDSVFIVGVLNRRSNPLIRPTGDTTLRYFTTHEFDSLTLGSDSLWRTQRYNQGGSREITIPFNYHDTLGRYAMLHVKELGGGIDTIIGQDSPLAMKFLPGEGKMFNVTILHPDAGVAGRLQYSNQRKMVGYPILRPDGTPSDSVYYHLTYHRYDPIAARNSVYYRRSEAVWYNSSSENVTWQPEKLLGEHIRVTKCSGDTIMRFSCAYPSLVVRYDESDSSNKVYVVYACMVPAYDSCNAAVKRVIVENVFKAESTVDDTARYFDTYIGELSEYGTPMVNASSGGNYYCWSDSTKGIVVGWKPPNARELTDFRPLSWAAGNSSTTLGCKHPSMNSYSRISLGEADCALVWEEKINTPILHFGTLQRTHIFYTRLKMIGDTTIHHFLSPSFFSTGESVSTSSDGSIARMSTGAWAPNAHRLPSVYRDLVDSVVSGSSIGKQRDARTDCLVWSAQEYSIIANPPLYAMANLNDIIYRRTAWINDTSSVPTTWGVGGLCRIWNSGIFLENPSISQGISKVYNTGLFSINESDSAVLIHINDYTTTLSGTVNKLWHIRGNINYLYSGQDTSVSGYYNDGLAKIVNTNGEYGKTAAFPVVSGVYSWRKNRRIYQTDTASPRLEMSPRYFLKASDNDEQIGFIGFSDEESKYMLSSPLLNGTMVKFNRVRQDQLSNEQRVRYYDRVSTDWFTVGDTESLWLKSIGKNSELVMAFVERRNDGARFRVELGESDDTTALWTPIHLRRGGTEEYRFFILKRLTDENNRAITESSYGEEMVLRGIKTAISSQKMGANGIQEIDLGRDVNVGASIRVYPNPAREKVTVVVTDTNQKNTWHVKVMNVLGTILNEHDSKPNTSIEIVTEDYPTGIYYIIAESGKLNATARFVIMK